MLQLEQTITSKEIAEMVNWKHCNVLQKIDNFFALAEQNTELKNQLSKLFILDSYLDASGKANKMYRVTKKGCDFFANKLTSEKGMLFSMAYIDKFYQMETALKEQDTPSYMIEDPIKRAEKWIEEQKEKQLLETENKQLVKEIELKEETIINLVDEVELAEKRQHLNRIIRKGYKGTKISERWSELYKQFELKYHINLKQRIKRYEIETGKKINKLDYVDKVMNKLPELYEIACKLYANDVKKLAKELYDMNE